MVPPAEAFTDDDRAVAILYEAELAERLGTVPDLGQFLQPYRICRGMAIPIEEVARAARMAKWRYQDLEDGGNLVPPPAPWQVRRLADVLGVPPAMRVHLDYQVDVYRTWYARRRAREHTEQQATLRTWFEEEAARQKEAA